MSISRKFRTAQAGFTLIEIIVAIVVGAIVGVILFSYMGTHLIHSGDPIAIVRSEGTAEKWMERIIVDYVEEINKPASYTTALATIHARDYTADPYNMPVDVTLTRSYVAYDAAGVEVSSPGASPNLKVTVKAGGYGLTTILTSQRVSTGDPTVFY